MSSFTSPIATSDLGPCLVTAGRGEMVTRGPAMGLPMAA